MITLLVSVGLALAGPWQTRSTECMTTAVAVMVPSEQVAHADAALSALCAVDEHANEWRAGSPLATVNAKAGQAVRVPPQTLALVERGVQIGALTDGAFDISWAALWGLWDFRAPTPTVPSDAGIAARVAHIDYRQVRVDRAAQTVRIAPGMRLGVGGMAKGAGLDAAVAVLRARGVTNFSLTAGGQVYMGGTKDGRPWRVGVRDPRGGAQDWFALIEVSDLSVSTSGDYERHFIVDGVRYHHILDPSTGRPARGLRSVTVICPDATLADALSTAIFVMGRERGLALAASLPGVEAVIVDQQGQVHATHGASAMLTVVHPPVR